MPRHLPLTDMAERHSGLTKPIADGYVEAARVCLDRHHTSPQTFAIRNAVASMDALAEWEPADARIQSAWANEIDATEAGAYAFALAAVELSEGLYAVRRAETRTGADYYIAPYGKTIEDLEACLRLEVSGTDAGNEAVVERRLKEKVHQATKGDSNLPAMATVVGFQALLIIVENVGMK
mgnify:CR=1 FL=1